MSPVRIRKIHFSCNRRQLFMGTDPGIHAYRFTHQSSRSSRLDKCAAHSSSDDGTLIGAMLFLKQNEMVTLRVVCDVRHLHRHEFGPDRASTMLWQAQYCETGKLDDGSK